MTSTTKIPELTVTRTSPCCLCSDGKLHGNHNHTRKGSKRRKNCSKKCNRQDEPHWTKVLQASNGLSPHNLSSPPAICSPPASPMAAIGQSVSRFFKWISPNKKGKGSDTRNHSVSSEDSGLCPESPRSLEVSRAYEASMSPASRPSIIPFKPTEPNRTLLQMPSSSTLLTKRIVERQYQIQKPKPVLPNVKTPSNTSQERKLSITNQNQDSPANQSPPPTTPLTLQVPSPTRSPLTATLSCPSSQKSLRSLCSSSRGQLTETWPPNGHHFSFIEDVDEDVFSEEDNQKLQYVKNVEDFMIPYDKIIMIECLGLWRFGQVYKGRWHGSAMVQTFDATIDDSEATFWEETRKLSRVRHENIALFLGACTDAGKMCLVTSVCKGMSMYEKLHITREKILLAQRLNLSYQIAQAIAYLHAKNIVYKYLNPHNVFIEKQKATLSVIDFTGIQKVKEKDRRNAQLPYLAPELLTYVIAATDSNEQKLPYSLQSDIYAFGILLYELLSSNEPYESVPRDVLILQVSTGRRPQLDRLTIPQALKTLIERCWNHMSHRRPHSQELSNELLRKEVSVHSKFSTSEPDLLNKLKANNVMF